MKDWFLNVAINPKKKKKKECICRCITTFTQRKSNLRSSLRVLLATTMAPYANMVSSLHLPQKDCKENYPCAKLQISSKNYLEQSTIRAHAMQLCYINVKSLLM